MRKYVIALYIRLSIEDSKTGSMSIPSQQLLLREHAMGLPEWSNAEVVEFIDNGHSGANFERPAVQALLEQVRAGKIDCIMVKDLSRFGRNSIETGYFIERVFPVYHTRFISVVDDFDTINFKGDTGGMNVAFKYLISECYSRDMSMKTKSAKYAKMQRGEYQSKICPYGYKKGAEGRMEIDPEAAAVVRRIFRWAAEGAGAAEITRMLYHERVPTPGEYKAARGGTTHDISRTHGIWCNSTVLRMLDDERYLGTYIIGRHAVTEIGGQRVRRKPESEWFKIPDHHPPIIDRELFQQAKATRRRFSLPEKKPRSYPLRGKVYCGCCDHAMSRKSGKTAIHVCRHSQDAPSFPCHGLRIEASVLEDLVFKIIQAQFSPAIGIDCTSKEALDFHVLQQSEHDKRLQSVQDEKRRLYEQFVMELMDLNTYKTKKAELDTELVRLKNVCATVAALTKQAQAGHEAQLKRQEVIQKVAQSDSLTQALADTLIEKVYVFPGDRVEIAYKIQDIYSTQDGGATNESRFLLQDQGSAVWVHPA